jgi:hypothetical protein
MKREIRLYFNARLLSINEEALKKVTGLLGELEEKGFLKESRIIFDSTQEDEISEIFDKHAVAVPISKNDEL